MIKNLWDNYGSILSYTDVNGVKRISVTKPGGDVAEFRFRGDEDAKELSDFLKPSVKDEKTADKNTEGSKEKAVSKPA